MTCMKAIILTVLLAILFSLGCAGVFMLKRNPTDASAEPASRQGRMARALAWRVGLSVALFLFVLLSWRLGWISPRGIPIPR
jgi:hypothetical protein